MFVGMGLGAGVWQFAWLGLAISMLCAGALARSLYAYRGRLFEHRTVASLLGHVEVSPMSPVPATVTGTIIGKGVPGLIWSEDFILRDETGILFLDYDQPLGLWSWLFGLLRAGRYQGKEVRVSGWFRRGPTPYLEIYRMEVIDGSLPSRRCYSYHANVIGCALLTLIAAGVTGWLFVMGL
jgi:heat shock protein HtpX